MKKQIFSLALLGLAGGIFGCGGSFSGVSPGSATPAPTPTGSPAPGGGRIDLASGAPAGTIYLVSNYPNSGKALYAVRSDGSGRTLIASADSSSLYFRALSPDGKNLVYGVSYGTGKGSYLAKADGSGARTLAADSVYDLTFTPDSQKIAYTHSDPFSADSRQEAIVENLDGSGKRVVASGTYTSKTLGQIALSPDGTRIAATGDAGLIVESFDGSGRVTLAGADVFGFLGAPVFSPDGTKVAVSLFHRTDNTKSGIYALPLDASVGPTAPLPGAGAATLTGWTAAGILCYNSTSRLGSGSQKGSFTWLAIDPISGAARTIASWEPLQSYDLITTLGYGELSPDKTQLAWADKDLQIYRVSLAGGAPQKLTDTVKGANWNPTFNNDGTKITFTSSRDERGSVEGFAGGGPAGTLYVMSADGSSPTRLIDGYSTDYPQQFRKVKTGGSR